MNSKLEQVTVLQPLLIAIICIALFPHIALGSDIFFLQEGTTGCAWKTVKVPGLEEKTHLTTKTCPRKIAWNLKDRSTVFLEDKSIYSWDFDKKSAKLVTTISEKWNEDITEISMTADGSVRIGLMHAVEDDNIKKKGEKTFYRHEGKLFPSAEPSWGLPYIAEVKEFGPKKKWTSVFMTSTKWGAGETPGLSVASRELWTMKNVVSHDSLLAAQPCSMECDISLFPGPKTVIAGLKKERGSDWAYLPIKGGAPKGVLFGIAYGDSPHVGPPVYFCSGKCTKPIAVKEVKESQLSISIQNGYILISKEYDGTSPMLFTTKSATPVGKWPHAQKTIWLPF